MGKNKGKQFNLEKRAILSRMISQGNTAKEIGAILNMDSTSISREVKRNRIKSKKDDDKALCNDCLFKKGCGIVSVNKFRT